MNKIFTGIRFQTLALGTVPTLLMFVALFGYFLSARLADVNQYTDTKGNLMASQLAKTAEFGVITGNKETLDNLLKGVIDKEIAYIEIYDAKGALITDIHNVPSGNGQPLKLYSQEINRQTMHIHEYDEVLDARSPATDAPRKIGMIVVALVNDEASARQREIIRGSVILALAALALSGLLALIIGRSIIQPLVTLTAAVQRIATGDLSTRVNLRGNREVQELQRVINSLSLNLEKKQRELARNLQQLEKARINAEQASEAKTEFLATMSHELRTPMNGALGMLELLRDTPLSPEQLRYADIASDSTQHLLTVVNDILDFSRVESGRLLLEKRFFAFDHTLETCFQSFSLDANRRGLALELSTDPLLHTVDIEGDEARLRQIIINLVGNALKFTIDGGVFITALCDEPHDGRIVLTLEVKDTGIGIEAESLKTIFDSFQQADGTMVRRFGGSGLGLTIVSKLVSLMGGTISVSSTPGTGSLFTCRLPFAARLRQATNTFGGDTGPLQLEARNKRVLVVEDNQVNQLVVEKMLEKLGVKVTTASTGTEAIDFAINQAFDVIFMDCQMPEMDGFETTRWIRHHEGPNQHVPIIALTANALTAVKERCIDAGMNDYLSKPVKQEQLWSKLGQWLKAPAPTN